MLRRFISTLTSLTVIVAVATTAAAETAQYTGDQFAEIFRSAPLQVAAPTEPPPPITGDVDLDTRIRSMAEAKGYVRQPEATGELVWVDGSLLQVDAAAAWRELAALARSAGHSLVVVSGYRSMADQRTTFLRRLSGYSEAALDYRLSWSAPPGYSKHHTGYALDVTVAGSTAGRFGTSSAYQWMTADNYRNAKRFGFIPSYPPDGPRQGPNPEPWEWLYVGVDSIACASDAHSAEPPCRMLAFTSGRFLHHPPGVWPE